MCYFGQVDVVCKLLFVDGFEIKFFDFGFIDYDDLSFFGMCGVD